MLGIHPNNTEALEAVMEMDWASLTRDSPEVEMVLLMHHNPSSTVDAQR
jgi:hypothetical protein